MARKGNRHRPSNGNRQPVALPAETSATLAVMEREIERAKEQSLSKQPRFQTANKPDLFFSSVVNWLKYADLQEPAYALESMKRDQWLRHFWKLEPHLQGVMNSVIALDKNRGWSLTGGRNQVYRYTDILHNAYAAPGLYGWRNFFSAQALSYYATDMGAVTELGFEGRFGPLRELYHTDSARCRLSGDNDFPIQYHPSIVNRGAKAVTRWPADSFFRVASMPSDDEKYHGLGWCAVSRVLELAKLMTAIYRKDHEMLGARMPEGLLILQGIQQEQWDTAMADREAKLSQKERQYFGGVFVLATAGIDQVDAKLIALRQLPENFNLLQFTNLLMYSYALTFGYSPREFWPVSSGNLGTATEAETQDDNSTSKGESDFILNYQERLNDELPQSLLYEFDRRDAKGDLEVAEILTAKATFIDTMSKVLSTNGLLLTAEQILKLAVDQELIPEEWLTIEADVVATDTESDELERYRSAARKNTRVIRAAARFPSEAIIRYHWPDNREMVLFDDQADMLRRRTWGGIAVKRNQVASLTAALEKATQALNESGGADTEEIDDMKATEFLNRMETLINRMQMAPAVSSQPIIIHTRPDGNTEIAPTAQPPIVNVQPSEVIVNMDTTQFAEALKALPVAPSVTDIVSAMSASLAMIPRGPDVETIAHALMRALLAMPKGPDVAAVVRAVAEAPQPEPINYEALGSAIANALLAGIAAMPVPAAPVVNVAPAAVTVTNPEPVVNVTNAAPAVNITTPKPVVNVEVQMPAEKAVYSVKHDNLGRITEVTKDTQS